MKLKLYILLIFLVLTSCAKRSKQGENNSQKNEIDIKIDSTDGYNKSIKIKDSPKKQSLSINEMFKKTLKQQFYDARLFNLTDTIEADFNGDKIIDKAIFTSKESKKGIIIFDGKTNLKTKIGLGTPFEEINEFDWVDFWGLVKDSTTYEIIIEDGEIWGDTIIRIKNPSIVLRKLDVGGGLITYNGNKYKWIHQSD